MRIVYRSFRFLLSRILSIVGVGCATACFPACMYGCPHSDFTYTGMVTDDNNVPIEGISVKVGQYYIHEADTVFSEEAVAFTDGNGRVTISGESVMPPENILLEDVDGTDNGGEFESKIITVEPEKVAKGKDHWDNGDYEAEFATTLKRVEK